jgi:hypothetical protein
MDGREWCVGRIRPQAASDVFSRVVAALGEPLTAKAEEGSRRSCSVVFLFSKSALEEPFRMAEGG